MSKIIHRTRLFNGRPAAEVYAEDAWPGRKCLGCGGPPVMRAQIFVALADMSSETRTAILYEIAFKRINTVQTVKGPAIRQADVVACHHCKRSLERQLAKAPSYCMIDRDLGPGPDNPIVGVIADVQ